MFNKTLTAIAFMDPRPRPLTLEECGARRVPAFHRASMTHFFFLAGGAGTRGGASTAVETNHPATGRHALAFEEKPNNSRKQVQQNKY
jgi:hypothetical protein